VRDYIGSSKLNCGLNASRLSMHRAPRATFSAPGFSLLYHLRDKMIAKNSLFSIERVFLHVIVYRAMLLY
jgi:hypothetical protein